MKWCDSDVMWYDVMKWCDMMYVGENVCKKKLRSGCPPSMMAKHEASPPPDPRICSEIKIFSITLTM